MFVRRDGSMSRAARMTWLLLVAALLAACTLLMDLDQELPPLAPDADAGLEVDGEADADVHSDADTAAEADVHSDADTAAEADFDHIPVPGPITLVADHLALSSARSCDLDGDGDLDNAIADVGSPGAEMLLMVINSRVQGTVDDGYRLVAHFPWVEDATGPSDRDAILIAFTGCDLDDPPDPTDDFSGEEPYFADGSHLDACGEPLCFFSGARMDRGALLAEGGSVPLPFGRWVLGRSARIEGTVAGRGVGSDLTVCAQALIRELGESPGTYPTGDITLLEEFLVGGAAWGMPSAPGISPDIDLDGDGLERFVLDEDGAIEACVDGDGVVMEGGGCWNDERIADGFALVFQIHGVKARFAGIVPGWEDWVEGECSDPPAVSLWDAP